MSNDSPGENGNYSVIGATAGSINGAFASMAQKLDLCDIKTMAENFGVHRADGTELRKNPSFILGTNEVAPLTMAAAYAGIANNGTFCAPVAIDQITNARARSSAARRRTARRPSTPSSRRPRSTR